MDDNNFQVWKDVAKEIGWIDYAVCQDYIRYLQVKNKELERRLDEAEKVTQWNRDNMIHPAQILTIVEDFDSNEKNGYSYDTLFHYFMDAIQKLCKTGN